jgi:hypothetical protein
MNNEILDDCKLFADMHRGKNKTSGPYWSTIIRFPKLYDEAVRLEKRVEALEAYITDYCAPTISDKYNEIEHLQIFAAAYVNELALLNETERLEMLRNNWEVLKDEK